MNDEIDNETLARIFHKAYERLAPQFGYETRSDTREFDPSTPNGRLMIAVCGEVRHALQVADLVPAEQLRDAEARVRAMEKYLRENRRKVNAWKEQAMLIEETAAYRWRDQDFGVTRVEAVLREVRQFIKKGIELGLIRMPDTNAPDDIPRTVYELWESVERNQCDGCARGLPIDEHGIHRGEGYDVIVCTADRYAYGDDHA